MNQYEILELFFQRSEAFQDLWATYSMVSIGILAAMVTFPKHLNSKIARLIIIGGFLTFGWANRDAILQALYERCELRVEACIAYNIADYCQQECCATCDRGNKYPYKEISHLNPTQRLLIESRMYSALEVRIFHWFNCLFIILLIWFVPNSLIRLNPARQARQQKIRIRRSKLPSPVFSYDLFQKVWILEDEVTVDIELKDHENLKKIRIPKGFSFDLASIPRFLWTMVAPFELSIIAPLVHDFIYAHSGKLIMESNTIISSKETDSTNGSEQNIRLERLTADTIFLDHMQKENVGKLKAWLAYLAVRLFGWLAWND